MSQVVIRHFAIIMFLAVMIFGQTINASQVFSDFNSTDVDKLGLSFKGGASTVSSIFTSLTVLITSVFILTITIAFLYGFCSFWVHFVWLWWNTILNDTGLQVRDRIPVFIFGFPIAMFAAFVGFAFFDLPRFLLREARRLWFRVMHLHLPAFPIDIHVVAICGVDDYNCEIEWSYREMVRQYILQDGRILPARHVRYEAELNAVGVIPHSHCSVLLAGDFNAGVFYILQHPESARIDAMLCASWPMFRRIRGLVWGPRWAMRVVEDALVKDAFRTYAIGPGDSLSEGENSDTESQYEIGQFESEMVGRGEISFQGGNIPSCTLCSRRHPKNPSESLTAEGIFWRYHFACNAEPINDDFQARSQLVSDFEDGQVFAIEYAGGRFELLTDEDVRLFREIKGGRPGYVKMLPGFDIYRTSVSERDFEEQRNTLVSQFGFSRMRDAEEIMLLISDVCRMRTKYDAMVFFARIVKFLNPDFLISDLYYSVKDQVIALFDQISGFFETRAINGLPQTIYEMINNTDLGFLSRTKLMFHFRKMIAIMISTPILMAFSLPMPQVVRSFITKFHTAGKDGALFLAEVLKLIKVLIYDMPIAMYSGDWKSLEAAPDKMSTLVQEVTIAVGLKGTTYDQSFSKHYDLAAFREKLRELELRARAICDDVLEHPSIRLEARRLLQVITEEQINFMNTCGANIKRKRPFAFLLYGPPGSGKSNIVEQFAKTCLIANGEEIPDKLSYTINGESKHFDGWVGPEPLVLHEDPTIAAVIDGDVLDIHNKINTNSEFSPFMAEVTKKDAIHPCPKISVITANTCRIADGVQDPAAAFYRRMHLYIYQTIKPQFTGSIGLSEQKAMEDGTGDYFTFMPQQAYAAPSSDPLNPPIVFKNLFDEPLNHIQMAQYLAAMYCTHMRRQEILVRMLNEKKHPICSVCKVVWTMHGIKEYCPYGGLPVQQDNKVAHVIPFEIGSTKVSSIVKVKGKDVVLEHSKETLIGPKVTVEETRGIEKVVDVATGEVCYAISERRISNKSFIVVLVLFIEIIAILTFQRLFVPVFFIALLAWLSSIREPLMPLVDDSLSVIRLVYDLSTTACTLIKRRFFNASPDAIAERLWLSTWSEKSFDLMQRRIKAVKAFIRMRPTAYVGIIVMLISGGALFNYFWKKMQKEDSDEKTVVTEAVGPEISTLKAERVVWKSPDALPAVSYGGAARATKDEVKRSAIERARVLIIITDPRRGKSMNLYGMALGGTLFVTYAHGWDREDHLVELAVAGAIAPHPRHWVYKSEMYDIPGKDLRFFRFRGAPSFPKYRYLLDVKPAKGALEMGHIEFRDGKRRTGETTFEFDDRMRHHQYGSFVDYFVGYADSINGDCGSFLIGERGTIIGLVIANGAAPKPVVFAVALLKEDVVRATAILYGKEPNPCLPEEPLEVAIKMGEITYNALSEYSMINKIPSSIEINGMVIGTMDDFHASRNKSQMCKTIFFEQVAEEYPALKDKYAVPHGGRCTLKDGSVHTPFSRMLSSIATQSDEKINRQTLTKAMQDMLVQYRRHTPSDLKILPITFEQAVRGTDVLPASKSSTSSGIGRGGPKQAYYIYEPRVNDPDFFRLNDEAMGYYACFRDLMDRGEIPVFTSRVFLKLNEVRSKEKIDEAGTRTINCVNFVMNCMLRKAFGPIFSAIQPYLDAHECCLGVNMASSDATKLYRRVTKFGVDNINDEDCTHMDDSQTRLKIESAFEPLLTWASEHGYPLEEIRDCRLLIAALVSIVYILRGDMVIVVKNASGTFVTTNLNSYVTSLMFRYAYFDCFPDRTPGDFEKENALINYGDDVERGVCNSIRESFTHNRVVKGCSDFGMIVTTGSKDPSDKGEYRNVSRARFLKRAMILDTINGLEMVRTPIEEESIAKMLLWWEPSESLPRAQHAAVLLENAQREFWMYGREVFDKKQKFLRGVAESVGLSDKVTWLTYDEFFKEYVEGKFTTMAL